MIDAIDFVSLFNTKLINNELNLKKLEERISKLESQNPKSEKCDSCRTSFGVIAPIDVMDKLKLFYMMKNKLAKKINKESEEQFKFPFCPNCGSKNA
jgi:hypothetical protein